MTVTTSLSLVPPSQLSHLWTNVQVQNLLHLIVNMKSATTFCWFPLIDTLISFHFVPIVHALIQVHISYIYLTVQLLNNNWLSLCKLPQPQNAQQARNIKAQLSSKHALAQPWLVFPKTSLPLHAQWFILVFKSLLRCSSVWGISSIQTLIIFHCLHKVDSIKILFQIDLSSQLLWHLTVLTKQSSTCCKLLHESVSLCISKTLLRDTEGEGGKGEKDTLWHSSVFFLSRSSTNTSRGNLEVVKTGQMNDC